jgi:hypothetical protein
MNLAQLIGTYLPQSGAYLSQDEIVFFNEKIEQYYDLPQCTVVALDSSMFAVPQKFGVGKLDDPCIGNYIMFGHALDAGNEIAMLNELQWLDEKESPFYDECDLLYQDWLTMQPSR